MSDKEKIDLSDTGESLPGALENEFKWLKGLMTGRINRLLDVSGKKEEEVFTPEIDDDSFYARFVINHGLTIEERLVLILALAREIEPEMFDAFFIINKNTDKVFTEVGGIYSNDLNGFTPTLKTALFLLPTDKDKNKTNYKMIIDIRNKFILKGILKKNMKKEIDPIHQTALIPEEQVLQFILTGEEPAFEYSPEFPARALSSLMEWDDLVLPESTEKELRELLAWPDNGSKLIKELGMGKHMRDGYRALFYGPPGTGKTLAASLLGKKINKKVYRIDLSQLVSKYIGETEKNLEKIFDAAENRDWILFFDEADALFGKRTSIGSSNDRFANQETAYLLQRVEVCQNIVILASNLKGNIDPAFTRRFQSIVYFPVPDATERLRIWKSVISDQLILDNAINLNEIAEKYDLTGGSIVNVVRFAALMSMANGTIFIKLYNIMEGIKREYAKQGRTV